jgi:hypothetical protein
MHALVDRIAKFDVRSPKEALFGGTSGNTDEVNITRLRGGGRQ